MKRIDKHGLEKCKDIYLNNFGRYDKAEAEGSLISDFVDFCNEEIKTVPRVATINTVEDLHEAEREIGDICTERKTSCTKCRLDNKEHTCFEMYLAEEIEVEE